MVNKVTNPQENKKLSEWKSKLERAKNAYEQELARMEKDQAYYDGTHSVLGNRNSNKAPTKQANNVRNIVYVRSLSMPFSTTLSSQREGGCVCCIH